MKKYIVVVLLLFVGCLCFAGSASANSPTISSIVKKPALVRTSFQSVLYSFGFDVDRDANLLLERLKLQEEKHSRRSLTQLFRFLRQYTGKQLVHKQCKVAIYKPLGHDFYAEIGTVTPFYNTIVSYKIGSGDANSSSRSQEYLVGTGDVDMKHDNCGDQYAGKNDKPANCARRMRTYFADHEFQITKCK